MSAAENKPKSRGLFSIFKRGEDWVEISGYRVGDILLDESVFIAEGANLVGNIIAPRIRVAGLVYGSIAAQETTLLRTGQIWGDLFTGALDLESGSKVQGWVCTLDATAYHQIRSEEIIPQVDPELGNFEMPMDGNAMRRTDEQYNLVRKLQDEVGAALSARSEIERTFDKRLQEVAGETAAKVVTLTEQLQDAETTAAAARAELAQQAEQTLGHLAQVEIQAEELKVTQQLLAERNQELDLLREDYEHQVNTNETLQQQRTELENATHEARAEMEKSADRVAALDTALQANVQHSTEQEEALQRWQELAEDTQSRADALAVEVRTLQSQLLEGKQINDLLQEQRRQLAANLEEITSQLEAIRLEQETAATRSGPDPEALLNQIAELETELQRIPELEAEIAQIPELVAQLAEQTALAERAVELEPLQQLIAAREQELQEQTEQLIWYKANLETDQLELQSLRQQVTNFAEERADLHQQLHEQANNAKVWRQKAEMARDRLRAKNENLAALTNKLDTVMNVQEQLQEDARKARHQLQEQDEELTRYLDDIKEQGTRLAEARSLLIERDLELREAQEKVAQQARSLTQFKDVAASRIKSMQLEMARTKRQLADATSVLERRDR